ncbi:MAG TPA: universal stress protein [Planctomycetes bacterium]|nr:universal stress protein [Planctomycetota bacterium]
MSVFHKVLVALRGAPDEAEYLALARELCPENGEIRAIHAIDIPRFGIFSQDEIRGHERLIRRVADRIEESFRSSFDRLRPDSRSFSGVLVEGRPHEEILREAESWNADLILTGGARHKGLEATALGSEAIALVEHSRRPVFVAADAHRPKILVAPVNFGDLSARGVAMAADLAAAWNCPLELVHVSTGSWPLYPEFDAEDWWDTAYAGTGGEPALAEAARQKLAELAENLRAERGLDVQTKLLGGAVPGYAIAEHVDTLDEPLVVMGSLGRALTRGAHLGETARRFLRSSSRPLLTFKTEAWKPRILDHPRREDFFRREFTVED